MQIARNNRAVIGVVAALSLWFSGCTSQRLEASKTLATAGAATVGQLSTTASSIYKEASVLQKLEAIEVGATTGAPPSAKIDEEALKRILAALKGRAAVANDLVAVYAALGKLTTHDARAEVDTAFAGLMTDVNKLASVVGTNPVSNLSGQLVQITGGLFARQIQIRALTQANGMMIPVLTTYKESLAAYRVQSVSLAQDISARRYNIARVLWRRGLLSAEPLVAEVVANPAFKTSDKLDYTTRNPALAGIVEALILAERDQRGRDIASEYDKGIAAVQELIDAHKKFTEGVPINLEGLIAEAQELRDIAGRLNTAVDEDKK